MRSWKYLWAGISSLLLTGQQSLWLTGLARLLSVMYTMSVMYTRVSPCTFYLDIVPI